MVCYTENLTFYAGVRAFWNFHDLLLSRPHLGARPTAVFLCGRLRNMLSFPYRVPYTNHLITTLVVTTLGIILEASGIVYSIATRTKGTADFPIITLASHPTHLLSIHTALACQSFQLSQLFAQTGNVSLLPGE